MHTQAIPHRHHHQPPSLLRQHCRYLANPIAATTTTMPSLAPTLTCIVWHTQATPPPLLSLCVFFSSFYFFLVISLHFELVQDSVSCDTAATTTSPRTHTGYLITVISPTLLGHASHPIAPTLMCLVGRHEPPPLTIPGTPLKKKVSLLFPSSLTSPSCTHPTALCTWLHKDN